jgi:hypothetical protein
MKIIEYDISKYNFIDELHTLYEINNLQQIHKDWSQAKSYELLNDVKTDQSTVYHRYFYDEINKTDWYKIYKKFIADIIKPLFSETIIYQKIPTFRVHQPDNLAVAAYHKDRDYAHSTHEVNFFLPLTPAFDNNTIWVETEEDKADYSPMEAEVGQCIMWDGANLMHGNKTNDTGVSRVSVDFRALPESKYIANTKVSFTNNTKMTLGGYYDKI